MKASELRQKPKEDLEFLLAEKRRRVLALRSLVSEKKVKNFREISAVKKDIARALTVLREKKHA